MVLFGDGINFRTLNDELTDILSGIESCHEKLPGLYAS